ncbi:MAG: hypothetical protein ABI867_27410 [Kofleriaceae bacterium]
MSHADIAAAGTLDPTDAVLAHLASCARCRELVDEQQAVRSLAIRVPSPPALASDRRAALAAEVAARADAAADFAPRWWRSRTVLAAGLAVAAAAIVAVVLSTRRTDTPPDRFVPDTSVPDMSAHRTPETHAPRVPDAVSDTRTAVPEPKPQPAGTRKLPAQIVGASAEYARDTTSTRDLVTLRDGTLAIDATRARPILVVAGTTRVVIASANASVAARKGVIQSITVFAGAVEVTVGDRRRTIGAGMVWDRDSTELHSAGAAPTAPPDAAVVDDASALAFREGWTALRSGNHAAAITAFDRAVALDRGTDPVVAEDAAYWAAIASERSGDRAGAAKRFTDFVVRFPRSPHAAKAALRRP